MISLLDILTLIIMTPISWISSFLLHEWMHIKSQGLHMNGTIHVRNFGMTCSSEFVHNYGLMQYAGGIYSGIVYLVMGILMYCYGMWGFYVPTITFALINIVYGLWEGSKGPKGRWKIYGLTSIGMFIFWIIHYCIVMR